jgi:hypothetical protein
VIEQQVRARPVTTGRWAPWWLYLVTIVGANYLRRTALPESSVTALRVVLALAFSAMLFAAITVVYRATRH